MPSPAAPDPPADAPAGRDRLVRAAVVAALAGFFLVLLFLLFGFRAWTVGVGVFVGCPLLVAAVVLYATAVIRDLRRREAL